MPKRKSPADPIDADIEGISEGKNNGDSIVSSIENIMAKHNRHNPLQPSDEQLCMLLDANLCLNKYSQEKWLAVISLTQHALFHGDNDKLENQTERAIAVVDQMMKTNKNHLITFDGHGRITYLILKCWMEKNNGKDIEMTVCDTNKTVTKWHEEFFPIGVESKTQNIFDMIIPPTAYIYMNFCNLGAAKPLQLLWNYILKPGREKFMISFSDMRIAKRRNWRYKPIHIMEKNGAELVCKIWYGKSWFYTYLV